MGSFKSIVVIGIGLACLSTPASPFVQDQGGYPHCAFYAFDAWVRRWIARTDPGSPLVRRGLDLSHLAYSYNYWSGNVVAGVQPAWMFYCVNRDGVTVRKKLPRYPGWQEGSSFLIEGPRRMGDQALPHELDFTNYIGGETNTDLMFEENPAPSPNQKYRHANFFLTQEWFDKKLAELEMRVRPLISFLPADLVREILHPLDKYFPVYLGVIPSFLRGGFTNYEFIGIEDLRVKPKRKSFHAMVAVEICHLYQRPMTPLCRFFQAAMKTRGVSKCIILQDSHGRRAHHLGYVGITPEALATILRQAYLPDRIPHQCLPYLIQQEFLHTPH